MKITVEITPVYSVYCPHGPNCRDVFHAITPACYVWDWEFPFGGNSTSLIHHRRGLAWPWVMARNRPECGRKDGRP